MKDDVVLVILHKDLQLLKIAKLSMEIATYDARGRLLNVATIPKPFVVCDACNARVGMTREDVEERGLPVGYAVIIADGHGGAFFYEVVCQKCRIKYFDGRPSFDTLEDAGINPTFI